MANWIPLESNPEVLNKYMSLLGVTSELGFVDVWSLDPELLGMIEQPVGAVILLFPITENYEINRQAQNNAIITNGQVVSKDLYFIRQTIGNACGTIGLFHSLANNVEHLNIGNGSFYEMMESTKGKTPDERAEILGQSKNMEEIHHETSLEGQTNAPAAEEEVNLHFVCFVQKEGMLYEMDGRNPFPINHGTSTDLLLDSSKIIKKYMDQSTDDLNFTVLAFAKIQNEN
ncbi:hypothetical protein BC833DRAFT_606828 [Globomyces pollinis-pini]|nr:hypothetical protein BC833DRAFT_606828 [Globomyces pollinis-pini]